MISSLAFLQLDHMLQTFPKDQFCHIRQDQVRDCANWLVTLPLVKSLPHFVEVRYQQEEMVMPLGGG
jgi:hypothetical protein